MTRLASFGGAGGQHACEISEVRAVLTLQIPKSSDPCQLLGIERVLIHKYSSVLSAYGLALADRCVIPLRQPRETH